MIKYEIKIILVTALITCSATTLVLNMSIIFPTVTPTPHPTPKATESTATPTPTPLFGEFGPISTSINLIQNQSLELDSDSNGIPDQWYKGYWGTNTRVFTYPAAGIDGARAAKITMSSYSSGDAKWYFANVPVTAGQQYRFQDSYNATVSTQILVRYTKTGEIISYATLSTPPATTGWQTANILFTPPAGTVSVTIFHLINKNGSLTIDKLSLTKESVEPTSTPTPTPTPDTINPKISFFDVQPRTIATRSSVTASFTVTDTGGSFVKSVGLNRAPYNASGCNETNRTNCAWTNPKTANAPANLNSWTSTLQDNPATGTWWYGLAVFDNSGKVAYQPMTIKVTVNALTSPTPTPSLTPTPAPSATGKFIMLNVINWDPNGLNNLPINDASELTYFVLPISSGGTLLGVSNIEETKFVNDVHAGGKKATFSIAGGSQNISDITQAVTVNTNTLINNIAFHISQHGYDGVTLDIENTNIDPQKMADFVNALRAKLNTIKPNLIIGVYTQPYQFNTVFSKIDQAASSLTWLSPMIYDFSYTITDLTNLTRAWLPKVGNDKSKLVCGIAVNYETGLNTTQFGQVLDIVKSEGWKGVGIWEHTLYIQPWRDVRRSKWPIIN